MAPRNSDFGPLELQILGFLSPDQPRNVSEVQSALKRQGSELAYTTVMTVLSRLFRKGHLKRTKEGRQFLYSLAPEKEKARLSLFNRMKMSIFQNNRLNPILALLNSSDELSVDELRALKKAVDEKLKSTKERL